GDLERLNTATFLQYSRSLRIFSFSFSSLIKEKSVISCFLERFLIKLKDLVCPPDINGYGKYGVSINIFIF
ncbi:hypothetical protein CO176_01495, partial [Candidatus Woesebacteria bacterium CG_4_9_14_3_um_filter_39_10]